MCKNLFFERCFGGKREKKKWKCHKMFLHAGSETSSVPLIQLERNLKNGKKEGRTECAYINIKV
jgi:hypothetical protein